MVKQRVWRVDMQKTALLSSFIRFLIAKTLKTLVLDTFAGKKTIDTYNRHLQWTLTIDTYNRHLQ